MSADIADGREVFGRLKKIYDTEHEQAANQMAEQLVAYYNRVSNGYPGIPAAAVCYDDENLFSDLAKKYRWNDQVRAAATEQLREQHWSFEKQPKSKRLGTYILRPLAK